MISEEFIEKAKDKKFIDKDGNLKENYVIALDANSEKIANFLKVDDKDYIETISKNVEEKIRNITGDLESIDRLLFSNFSTLSYKVDAAVYEHLLNFSKLVIHSNNNMESFLYQKHGDKFIQEVKDIAYKRTFGLLELNFPHKDLEETLLMNQKFFAEILDYKLEEVVAKIKLSSSEVTIADNTLCILQLAIYKGLVNKTIEEIIQKMDKFVSRQTIIDNVNQTLKEFDYELLK